LIQIQIDSLASVVARYMQGSWQFIFDQDWLNACSER